MKAFRLLVLFCFLGLYCQAQDFIYLKSKTSAKTKKIYLYNQISVKASHTNEFYKGTLFQISPGFIVVDDVVFYLDSIEVIRTYNKNMQAFAVTLAIGTAGFASIFVINNAIDSQVGDYNNFQVIWVATMVVATVVTKAFVRKSHPQNKWRWETYQIPNE